MSTILGCGHTVRSLFHLFEVEVWTADGVNSTPCIGLLTSGDFMAKLQKTPPNSWKKPGRSALEDTGMSQEIKRTRLGFHSEERSSLS